MEGINIGNSTFLFLFIVVWAVFMNRDARVERYLKRQNKRIKKEQEAKQENEKPFES